MENTNETVLTVVQETEILGKSIKMYGSVESPLFKASDVAEWDWNEWSPQSTKSLAS